MAFPCATAPDLALAPPPLCARSRTRHHAPGPSWEAAHDLIQRGCGDAQGHPARKVTPHFPCGSVRGSGLGIGHAMWAPLPQAGSRGGPPAVPEVGEASGCPPHVRHTPAPLYLRGPLTPERFEVTP